MKILNLILISFIYTSSLFSQESKDFEGIIKYLDYNSHSNKSDTIIYYIKKRYIRQQNLNSDGLVSNIYINLEDVPNKTIITFNDKRNHLVSIAKDEGLHFLSSIDTTTKIDVLGFALKQKIIKYDKSYISNDYYYTQMENKIFYTDSIAFNPPKSYNMFNNIFHNGTGKIALYIETNVYSDMPIGYKNMLGPSKLRAIEVSIMKNPDELVKFSSIE